MRLEVLGPLPVTRRRRAHARRSEAAAGTFHLLVNANELLPADELIERVWEDEPPDCGPRHDAQRHLAPPKDARVQYAFWDAMLRYIKRGPDSLDPILSGLDAAWPDGR
jgi:hypothetical protein